MFKSRATMNMRIVKEITEQHSNRSPKQIYTIKSIQSKKSDNVHIFLFLHFIPLFGMKSYVEFHKRFINVGMKFITNFNLIGRN